MCIRDRVVISSTNSAAVQLLASADTIPCTSTLSPTTVSTMKAVVPVTVPSQAFVRVPDTLGDSPAGAAENDAVTPASSGFGYVPQLWMGRTGVAVLDSATSKRSLAGVPTGRLPDTTVSVSPHSPV